MTAHAMTGVLSVSKLPRPSVVAALGLAERAITARILERLEACDPDSACEGTAHVTAAVYRIEALWVTVEMQPSILRGQTLGGCHRDLGSLIDVLTSCNPFSAEAFLPTRASLCRAFLLAKLNFCRLLAVVTRQFLSTDPEQPQLLEVIEAVQTSAVCGVMAEDLMRMIASDEPLTLAVRRRAARILVQMWEYGAEALVDRLFPVLTSAWRAKNHVTIGFGALSGVTELLGLMSEGCDPRFIDCFLRDGVRDDEELALQEFVFNIPYEQLQRIQRHMAQSGTSSVDAEAVAAILEVPSSHLRIQTRTCEDMVFTFRERQALAGHRRAFELPGPKRTAEQYLMTYLLEGIDDLEIVCREDEEQTA